MPLSRHARKRLLTRSQSPSSIPATLSQFKGVFVRHLAYALPTIASVAGDSTAVGLEASLMANLASLLANATSSDPATGFTQFGALWQGPFNPPGGKPNAYPFVAQGSGLDLVLAALSVLQRRADRA